MVYASVAPEAPRPHVVKLDLDNDIEEEMEDLENMDADRLRSMSEEYSDTLTRLLDQLEDTERQYIDSSDLRQGDV